MVSLGSRVLSPVQPLELTALSGFIGSRNLCCPLESDTIKKGPVICRQRASQTQVKSQ
jgi:hypothetical protein